MGNVHILNKSTAKEMIHIESPASFLFTLTIRNNVACGNRETILF